MSDISDKSGPSITPPVATAIAAKCSAKIGHNPKTYINPDVKKAISAANRDGLSRDTQDEILRDAVSKAKTVADIWALADRALESDVKHKIITDGIALARCPDDYLFLARTSYNAWSFAGDRDFHDMILLLGAPSCTSLIQVDILAEETFQGSYGDQILLSRLDLCRSYEDFEWIQRHAATTSTRTIIQDMGEMYLVKSLESSK
ncbi:MAG: hypothetical protein WA705_23230 [Candidatus Ozemobacteraceae bacterium]